MKRITKGNDFTLRIPVMKVVRGERVPFPIPACTDVQVRVCDSYKRIELAYEVDAQSDNVILTRVEGDKIAIGTYAVEVRGKILGNDWRSEEYPQFEIVARNADADLEFGESDDGDDSVEMDTALAILPPSVELTDAINRCNTSTAEAEKVNARLDGNILTVTNRKGEEQRLNLTDTDEHVTVNLVTDMSGVTVKGSVIYVYVNNGDVPRQYAADGNGQAQFTVEKGATYKVVFPSLQGCNPINPVQHVAAVGNRIIDAEYTNAVTLYEHVTVTIRQEGGDGVSTACIGKKVRLTMDNQSKEYATNEHGMASFDVPNGKSYAISTDEVSGSFEAHGRVSFTRTAMASSFAIPFLFRSYQSGIWLVDNQNRQYTFEEWEASGRNGDDLVFVRVSTLNTQKYQGDIYIALDTFANFSKISALQWCTENVLFNNIPQNGMDTGSLLWSKYAYNGLLCTETIIEEAKGRGLAVPAAAWCHRQTIDNGGKNWQGYLPTVYQWETAWSNMDSILLAVQYKYPDFIADKGNLSSIKWSSTQQAANASYYFYTSKDPNLKSYSFWTVPFFACPSAS